MKSYDFNVYISIVLKTISCSTPHIMETKNKQKSM